MIVVKNASKSFEKTEAIKNISLYIEGRQVFGLLGTNGAGKSTLLRLMAGIYKCDKGSILVDDQKVWDCPEAKKNVFYISDEQFFYANATPAAAAKTYQVYYPAFDMARATELFQKFNLKPDRKISTFSKGMKKQLSIIMGLCSGAKYLLCDETFDGLDPVMRQAIKALFAKDMEERGLTPIIASHNLRELEDICDHIGLLHEGGVVLSQDMMALKCNHHRVQMVVPSTADEVIAQELQIIKMERRGKLLTFTAKGEEDEIAEVVKDYDPVYWELVPLSLEEIFISEMEGNGYEISNVL